MYIKSITLDGFKSYGNRVEVTGFDPAFNAITGLNGTGKSNILDSICFVLGITNLSNVRAGSLTELIYKHGQAGITKASVSITFDNRDKSQAPVGYESADEITVTRQIVMGGKNKYLINGINVQNKRVSDLFCSVQLNVNNPHFLIMQGRITKVLNMKPPEILSMIEEAAGTSMYETKKLQALNTIAKKDAKLAELDDIIKEDIAPKLQKLQDERAQFQEHQQIIREIDGITKLYKAYQYASTEKKCGELEQQIQTAEHDIGDSEALIKDNEKECKAIDKEVAEMHKKLDAESSGVLRELEEMLSSAERQEAAAAEALRAAEACVAEREDTWRRDRRALQDDEAALQAKRPRADQVSESSIGIRSAAERSAAALGAAQERFLAVSSGLGGDVQEQLTAARRDAADATTRLNSAAFDLKAHEDNLHKLRAMFASRQGSANHQAEVAKYERLRRDLQRELAAAPYDEARHKALPAQRAALREKALAQREAVDALTRRLREIDFEYDRPQRNFDPSSVHGTVARLIQVPDPAYFSALQATAGNRVYNVIVDTQETGKLLLERGNLRTRITFIPLNKICPVVIADRVLAAAQEIGGGPEEVKLALRLVESAEVLAPAVEFVFGNTLVCRDVEMAKHLAFHERVRQRCVTLDGDLCSPAGTVDGGARREGPTLLQQVAELVAAEHALRLTDQQLQALDAELAALDRASMNQTNLEQVLHKLECLRAEGLNTQLQTDIELLEAKVSDIRSAVQRDQATQQEAAARAAQLEVTAGDIDAHRGRELKKAETAKQAAREAAERHAAAWRECEGELEALRLEVAELEASVEAGRAALEVSAAAHAAAAALRDQQHAAHQATTAQVQSVQDRIARQKAEVGVRSRAVGERTARRDALRAAARDAELRCKEVALALTALRKEATALRSAVAALAAEEPWIAAEKQFFGVAGGAYDFMARAADGAAARLERLTARRDALARGLNARAHTLHAKEEEQYAELLRKKRIVEADRCKLRDTMRSLDEKKRSTLLAAAEHVARDFAAIFSSLLPGADARLEPPPGCQVLDGLEVRVAFNGVWKESLGELSGGQRSLVALALVLAMLRFKPAPLYILDEVDAALDLSHTQNIGIMLRDHFQTSQFIIVSLKDGMFNNANVLFRTRFQDGMSSVQRTVNAAASRQTRHY